MNRAVSRLVRPARIDEGACLLDPRPAVLVSDDLGRAGDGEAVGQGMTGQIGVDQRGRDTDLGKADPCRQIFRPIQHHQGNDVTAMQTPTLGPVTETIGEGVELPECQGTVVVLNGDTVSKPVDSLLEVVTDQIRTIEGDRLDTLEQPTQSGRELKVAPDVRHQPHGRARLIKSDCLNPVMDNRPFRVNCGGNSLVDSHLRPVGLSPGVAPLRR